MTPDELKKVAQFLEKRALIIDKLMELAEFERQGGDEALVDKIIKTIGMIDISKNPEDLKKALRMYSIVIRK